MATNIATLNVSIVGNGSALRLDLKNNEAALKKFGNQAQKTGSGLTAAFASFAGFLGANLVSQGIREISSALTDLVKVGLEFNRTFTSAVAIQDLDATALGRLQEQVLKTSGSFQSSAAELNATIFDLASAGFSLSEQIAGIRTIGSFTQAGAFASAKEAAGVLIDITGALRLENTELARVGDVLVAANVAGKGSLLELSEAVKRAGPSAASFGVQLEQVAVFANAFAEAGIRGSEGGTAIERILNRLAQAAGKNANAFKELNISLFDSSGAFRLASDITGQFEEALAGASAEVQLQKLAALGLDAELSKAVLSIVGLSGKMQDWEKILQSVSGAMDDVANKRITDLDKALNKSAESWTRLGVAITPAVDALGKFTAEALETSFDLLSTSFQRLRADIAEFSSPLEFDALNAAAIQTGVDAFSFQFPQELPGLGDEFNRRAAAAVAETKEVIKNEAQKEFNPFEGFEVDLQPIFDFQDDLNERFRESGEELRDSLLTPAETLTKELEKIINLGQLFPTIVDDTVFARALEKVKNDFVAASLQLEKAGDEISREQRQSFVQGTQRGSIGDLANRIAGLDAAIGTRQQAKPEDIEQIRLMKIANEIAQQQLDEQKKAEVVALKISETDLQ